MSKIQCTKYNALNGMHVKDVEDVFKYMYSSRTYILHSGCLSETKFSRALHILENNSTL